jgi:hypothetical protein
MNILFVSFIVVAVAIVRVYGYTPGIVHAYLTPGQWGSIRHILSNPKTPYGIIQKTRKIIYTYYENWAIQRAHSFRKTHPGLCKHISCDELGIYSSKGLIRAIEGCDYSVLGNTPFSVYASKWIDYELLDGMTDLQPMTTLPKRIQKRKGIYNRKQYRVDSIDSREYLHKKRNLNTDDEVYEYEDAWERIDNILDTPFSNRAFRWKFSPRLNQVRSNAEVAELMGCSEETVRRAISGPPKV